MPSSFWTIVLISWVIAIGLWFPLWRSREPFWFKLIVSAITLFPILGPLLYFFYQAPSPLPTHLRATMNHYGVGGRFIGFGSKRFNFDPVDQVEADGPSTPVGKFSKPKLLTRWHKAGIVVALAFLAIYWTKAYQYLKIGDAWGHSNFWGQRVGTLTLTAVLIAGSLALAAVLWRVWLRKLGLRDGLKSEQSEAVVKTRKRSSRRKRGK